MSIISNPHIASLLTDLLLLNSYLLDALTSPLGSVSPMNAPTQLISSLSEYLSSSRANLQCLLSTVIPLSALQALDDEYAACKGSREWVRDKAGALFEGVVEGHTPTLQHEPIK